VVRKESIELSRFNYVCRCFVSITLRLLRDKLLEWLDRGVKDFFLHVPTPIRVHRASTLFSCFVIIYTMS
jgi:hypothetical protein